MNNNELLTIKGGVTVSGTLINSIAKLMGTLLNIGRSIGTSIRMAISKHKC
jgi:hypothetical protein